MNLLLPERRGRRINGLKGLGAILTAAAVAIVAVAFGIDEDATIGGEAFADCTSLTSMIIPVNVTSISGVPHLGCLLVISMSSARQFQTRTENRYKLNISN